MIIHNSKLCTKYQLFHCFILLKYIIKHIFVSAKDGNKDFYLYW